MFPLLAPVPFSGRYYAALLNPKSSRLELIRMVDGAPRQLAAVEVTIDVEFEREQPSPSWGWYQLEVRAEGDQIALWFEGRQALVASDSTFREPGRAGLLTHADAVAAFDDVRLRSR